jgi:hypothetical protein
MDCGSRRENYGTTSETSRRMGELPMKNQFRSADLRTDLAVTSIALSAVTACAVIGFMLNLVIAPF